MIGGPAPELACTETSTPCAAAPGLTDRFDAVVMLTWSDWKTEPRSNRYHYASRFARSLPVLFVQEDSPDQDCHFEPTEVPGVTVLHAPHGTTDGGCDTLQAQALARALRQCNIVRPLVWVYNIRMKRFLRCVYAPLKVYHATEDYVSGDYFQASAEFLDEMRATLDSCDVLVSVSEGVEHAYREKMQFEGETIVATNGCDFRFFAAATARPRPDEAPIAFYQGGINNRLDFELIQRTVVRLPHWQFRFCGRVHFSADENALKTIWKNLLETPNFTYLGNLKPEAVRDEMSQATVGLIPFDRNPTIVDRSFPLKAFEYVACGLPVAGVPVKSLGAWPELFAFAHSADELAQKIEAIAATRHDPALLEKRAAHASLQGYDRKFRSVVDRLLAAPTPRPKARPRKLLVLFDDKSTHVKTIEHHLTSFLKYSASQAFFVPCTGQHECVYDLTKYDAVIIHYCVRVCVQGHMSASYEAALKAFPGLKVLFAQDEYDHTNLTKDAVRELGIQCFFTCVPTGSIRTVYSEDFFDGVHFETTLTGYVPPEFEVGTRAIIPLRERSTLIGYRGRDIGYWYGDLAREKLLIGVRMKEICDARKLNTDIAWTHEKRIYGPGWFDFLGRCRATLGTESGSNIFDFDGQLKALVEEELKRDPSATYEDIHTRHLKEHEGKVIMNQVSPKLFEAITLRTALILFEGSYSGVVEPDLHFIPLKKDYSNVDEVLRKVQDDALIERMTERAYRDVVASGRYSYQAFMRGFDDVLNRLLGRSVPAASLAHGDSLAAATLEKPAPPIPPPAPVVVEEPCPVLVLPLPPPEPTVVENRLNLAYEKAKRLGKNVLRPARNVLRALLERIITGRKAG